MPSIKAEVFGGQVSGFSSNLLFFLQVSIIIIIMMMIIIIIIIIIMIINYQIITFENLAFRMDSWFVQSR